MKCSSCCQYRADPDGPCWNCGYDPQAQSGEPDDCHSIPQAKEWPKKVLDDADQLARMVCKLLREDMKGDAGTLMSGERRRLVNLASDWLEQYNEPALPSGDSSVDTLVRRLRLLNTEYKAIVTARKELPMEERRFKLGQLQQEANHCCGEIMRTERKILDALLAEKE